MSKRCKRASAGHCVYCQEGQRLQGIASEAYCRASRLAMAWTREHGLGPAYGPEVNAAWEAEHEAWAAFRKHVGECIEGGQ